MINKKLIEDVYSTDEVKTNKVWINGKPIYRKVFKGTSKGSISLSGLNIDEPFIDLAHSYIYWVRYTPVQLTTTSSSNIGTYMAGAYVNDARTSLVLEAGSSISISKFVIVLEYTKTTD